MIARDKPRVVCLCGSTRFMDTYRRVGREETLKGNIVLTVTDIVTYDGATDPQRANHKQKAILEWLHFRKIDISDEILVLNVGGYIGMSTLQAIEYARGAGKRVRWLERDIPGWKRVLNKLRRRYSG